MSDSVIDWSAGHIVSAWEWQTQVKSIPDELYAAHGQVFTNLSADITLTTAYQTIASLTAPVDGVYLISAGLMVEVDTTGGSATVELTITGAGSSPTTRVQPTDGLRSTTWVPFSGVKQLAKDDTILVQARLASGSTGTAKVLRLAPAWDTADTTLWSNAVSYLCAHVIAPARPVTYQWAAWADGQTWTDGAKIQKSFINAELRDRLRHLCYRNEQVKTLGVVTLTTSVSLLLSMAPPQNGIYLVVAAGYVGIESSVAAGDRAVMAIFDGTYNRSIQHIEKSPGASTLERLPFLLHDVLSLTSSSPVSIKGSRTGTAGNITCAITGFHLVFLG